MTTATPDSAVDIELTLVPFEQNDDPNHRSHYVRPADNGVLRADDPTTAQDIIDTARLAGTEVVALCGFRWVPKANPKSYPVCDACLDIAVEISANRRH